MHVYARCSTHRWVLTVILVCPEGPYVGIEPTTFVKGTVYRTAAPQQGALTRYRTHQYIIHYFAYEFQRVLVHVIATYWIQ